MGVNKKKWNGVKNKFDTKDGAYFKWNSQTGFAVQYQLRIEQRATTRGTGMRLVEIQKDCFVLVNDRYADTVMAVCPHAHADGPETLQFGQILVLIRSTLYKIFQKKCLKETYCS